MEYTASVDTAEQETSHSLIGCWGLGSNGIAHAHSSFFGFETEICSISGAHTPLISSDLAHMSFNRTPLDI